MTQTSIPTARRTYAVRGTVHVAIVGAENALCGVRLMAATPAEVADCTRCAGHRFETSPEIWPLVQPLGEDLPEIGGLPESTAGF
jgi:hypothetical protein